MVVFHRFYTFDWMSKENYYIGVFTYIDDVWEIGIYDTKNLKDIHLYNGESLTSLLSFRDALEVSDYKIKIYINKMEIKDFLFNKFFRSEDKNFYIE